MSDEGDGPVLKLEIELHRQVQYVPVQEVMSGGVATKLYERKEIWGSYMRLHEGKGTEGYGATGATALECIVQSLKELHYQGGPVLPESLTIVSSPRVK